MFKFLIVVRSLIVAGLYPLLVTVFAVLVVLTGIMDRLRPLQDKLVQTWAKISLWAFGVEIEVDGLDNLPAGGYLGLFNHTSNFDILAIQALIPRIRFGAKVELFRIPIFGLAMRAAKALPIARSQRDEVMKVYEQAAQRMIQGEAFILAPEGTRQREEKLGSFKAGPFLFAVKAQTPIVPIAIRGASRIQPKGAILPNSERFKSKIIVKIGKPIATEGLNVDSKRELQRVTFQAFRELGLK